MIFGDSKMKWDDIKKLHQKKYREQFGFFLLEGEHLILELQKAAQANPELQRSELYVTGAHENWQSDLRTHAIGDRQMAQIASTKTPQGIVAVVPKFSAPAARENETAIYLHEIQDPGNLGTILRTLAWFGNFRCLLSPGSVDPYNDKTLRAGMGAIFHVPIEEDIEVAALRERFSRIACLDMQGERVQSDEFKNFDCYVFGNEARGIAQEAITELDAQPFTIAGSGSIESLNIASAVNMCVYELRR